MLLGDFSAPIGIITLLAFWWKTPLITATLQSEKKGKLLTATTFALSSSWLTTWICILIFLYCIDVLVYRNKGMLLFPTIFNPSFPNLGICRTSSEVLLSLPCLLKCWIYIFLRKFYSFYLLLMLKNIRLYSIQFFINGANSQQLSFHATLYCEWSEDPARLKRSQQSDDLLWASTLGYWVWKTSF